MKTDRRALDIIKNVVDDTKPLVSLLLYQGTIQYFFIKKPENSNT